MKQLQRILGGGLTVIILIVALVMTFLSDDGGNSSTQQPEPVVTSDGVFLPTRVAMTAEAELPDDTSADTSTALPAEWYDIYFTNPTCPPEEERQGGLDEIVADDIRKAELQVDIAAFDFDSEPMLEALIELEERGVLVRVVTDEDNGDLSAIRRLRRNGISVVEDKRSALMHNKFVVIDGR